MSTAKNLVKSSFARITFMGVSAVIGFFMLPFLVGHLGERWYGIWVIVTGLVSSSYLLDLGMASAVSRFVATRLATGDVRGTNEVVNTCLAIYIVLAAIVFAAGVVVAVFAGTFVKDATDLTVIRAAIIILGLQYAAEFPFKAFAGIVASALRYDLLVMSRLLNLVLVTVLFVYFIRQGYGILALALIVLGADQLSNLLYYRIAKHLFRDLRIGPSFVRRALVRELFSYSSWSFVIQLANQLRFRIDSLVIGWLISVSAVTYYAVGLRLVEYFVDFVYKATNMMTPVFTGYYAQGNLEEIRSKYLMLTRINCVLALFAGGMIVILGKAFIVRWMGPGFERSYPVLVILMAAMMVEVIGSNSDNILYAISQHKYLAVINTIEGVSNLVVSVALARPFGIVGVALGTALPLLFFRLFVIPYYVGRFIGLPVWRYYRNLVPVTLFTGAYLALFWFSVHPLLEVPSYFVIVVSGIVGTLGYIVGIPFVAFDAAERVYMVALLPNRAQGVAAAVLRLRGGS